MGSRRAWVAVVLLATLGAAGCGDEASCPPRPTEVVEERTVEVAHRGPVLDVDLLLAGSTPGLVVEVTNAERTVERVRVTLDGETALDVDLPPAAECRGGHDPVFAVAYDPAPGPVEVALDVQGSTSTRTIAVPDAGTAWAVIAVQSQRAWADIQVHDSRPEWG